ncbi:hypothetical protein POV27_13870 [Aureisphaera galaxeae]|uniref:hypothetical protein n=1 Tax=Aureisphaera galaxeae TaxID=1538023 RepID=UPI002350FA8B|nr:hypothetical protein [Aureisphaera galaxeae]MDC8005144.1 hypothetical protein [Aureisphaera galaxeae]
MTITIKDESLTGDILNEIAIAVESEMMTVRDLIAARVASEVKAYNSRMPEYFKGLIQPSEAEKTLNGFRLKNKKKTIDLEKQIFVAYDAFQKNGYIILVNDEQVESLDQELIIGKETPVSFVKLTPLVGG